RREPAPEAPRKKSRDVLVVEALRLQHVHVRVKDASAEPPLEAKLDLDVRLTDLAVNAPQVRPAQLELTATCPPLLDSLRIEGESSRAGAEGRASLHVALERL